VFWGISPPKKDALNKHYIRCLDSNLISRNYVKQTELTNIFYNKTYTHTLDDSYTSIVLCVETLRAPRAEGCGPLGAANI